MKKIEINNVTTDEIIAKYEQGMSMRKLAKVYPYSFSTIQKIIKSISYADNIKSNYPQKDGHYLTAICKKTKKRFNDYLNESGALTTHLKKVYNIPIPSKYIRKNIEYTTGKFWYDQYFDFIYEVNKPTKKCHYCDWATWDVDNTSGAYEKHLKNVHGYTLSDHTKKYPEDEGYFKKEIYHDSITCEVCGKTFKSITNTHLATHGMTQLDYKIKYGNYIVSNTTKNKLKDNYDKHLKNNQFIQSSKLEEFIINNIPVAFEQSNRKILNGQEIDLLFNNIGFEVNGCIFHTEIFGKKNSKYHLNKTDVAYHNGVQLYHIFEDEITNKPEIVLNKIKHILNVSNDLNVIHARKCIITEEVDGGQVSDFLNNNHIQGSCNSEIQVSAKHNNELVGVMTFTNKRHLNKSKSHNNNIYELTRFTIKNDSLITGLSNRMLKYFINKYKPTKIISFADRRWTPNINNNLYTKIGFTQAGVLKPDYTYYNPQVHRHKRLHKFGFGKNSIKKRFPKVYDANKTEWEMMQELGYDRIWDCGKIKYELSL